MEAVSDVLAYVRKRVGELKAGDWIEVRQIFITRLKEQRYPTRAELDDAAPRNPVLFATGPDASLNTLALKESGIDRDFKVSTAAPATPKRFFRRTYRNSQRNDPLCEGEIHRQNSGRSGSQTPDSAALRRL